MQDDSIHFDPASCPPFDPNEFSELMQLASEVRFGGAVSDVIPHPSSVGLNIVGADGSTTGLHFTDVPENRIGIAITRRFRGEPEKG